MLVIYVRLDILQNPSGYLFCAFFQSSILRDAENSPRVLMAQFIPTGLFTLTHATVRTILLYLEGAILKGIGLQRVFLKPFATQISGCRLNFWYRTISLHFSVEIQQSFKYKSGKLLCNTHSWRFNLESISFLQGAESADNAFSFVGFHVRTY